MNAHLQAVRRLALAAGFVGALWLAGRTVSAQTPATPSVSVSGISFGQFLYQLKDSAGAGHQNQFSVQRAYINVIGKFAKGIQTRITADIAPSGTASQAFRLKYAYAAYTPEGGALTYKFGLTQTPWLDWEETLWDYRMQGSMALDRNGYLTAADFGAGIDGSWSHDQVNAQVAFVNGEGYGGGTGDNRKDVEARVSARVMNTDDASRVGGLRITGYAGIGKYTGGGNRNRFIGMVSYRSSQLTLAGEFASTKDLTVTGSVLSAFGVLHFTGSPAAVIARVDLVDPNTSVSPDKQTRLIAGLSYQLSPNVRLLGGVDLLSYQATPTPAQDGTRSRLLLQTQFTF